MADAGHALIILGTSGIGKSTVGRYLALRWPAKRYIDAGTIREVLREEIPTLRLSTYDSWKLAGDEPSPENLFAGFERYAELLWPAVLRVLGDAAEDQTNVVIDGAMLSPRLVASLQIAGLCTDARLLHLADPEMHLERLKSSVLPGSHQQERLVKNFPLNRTLQEYLVSECERVGLPVIENVSLERTLDQILYSLAEEGC